MTKDQDKGSDKGRIDDLPEKPVSKEQENDVKGGGTRQPPQGEKTFGTSNRTTIKPTG